MPRRLSLVALLLAPLAAVAQQNAKVPDPDPELERRTFVVPDGFEVNLFAADPMLAKPIQMNFDPQGRLWVASSEVYPQIKPGQTANDRVLVLEDTNGDGKADKTTVFADGLLIPTGVAPGDGGVYVADSTDLVHFSDPDPATGKARKKRIVLSGFGTEDTHHILHTLRWGPDGCLYFNQSIYIHSHIETPHGVKRLNAGGVWRFRPETVALDVVARGFVNPWGTQFDRWGQTFATDGAYGEGINVLMPGAYYFTNGYGVARILAGLNPGSPKHCGLAVLSGRHLPPDYQGNMVTNDFRGHRVCRFVLREDGSEYQSQESQELIKSTHPAFRPIDVAMGPDGAVYVADWYNPIIQHGEVDFRDPRRDHTHGRIWRITAKNRPLVEKPKLVGAPTAELLNHLKVPEEWTRLMAKRVLKERGAKDVRPELDKWVAALDAADPDVDHHRLEALWTYQSLDVVEPALLTTVLRSKDHHARAAACRVVAPWSKTMYDATVPLAPLAADPHPQVRLEAVRALGEIPSAKAAVAAARALDFPVDKWLDYALWLTFRDLAPYWLDQVKAGKLDFGGDPKKLVFALRAAGTTDVAGPLVKLLESGKVTKDREADVLVMLTQVGGHKEIGFVLARADRAGTTQNVKDRLLTAIEDAVRTRKISPPEDADKHLKSVLLDLGDLHTPTIASALRLAGLWKLEEFRRQLEIVGSGSETPFTAEELRAAFDGLVSLGGLKTELFLLQAVSSDRKPEIRCLALSALASVNLTLAADFTARILASALPSDDLAELFTAFVNRKGGPAALAKALAGKTLPADVARIGVRAAKANGQADAALIDALTKAGGLGAAKWTLAGKELNQFIADVGTLGDPARGERVFRRAELSCVKCHGIAGAGGQVGPDLTSIGASAPVDYLIDSILNPNSKIKEGYNSFVVTTVDGRVHTGIRVRESKAELVLRDAEDKETVIPAADIEAKKDGKSLMPDGLVEPLTRQELLDLTRFLSELGKVGPYAATPGRVVRRWQAVQPSPELFTLVGRDRLGAIASPAANLSWGPVYSLVSGDLPADAAPTFRLGDGPKTAAVRFQIEVTTAGPVALRLRDPAGLSVFLNGVPVEPAAELPLALPPGVQTVTILYDADKRTAPLRAELADVPGSPARARVVGGK